MQWAVLMSVVFGARALLNQQGDDLVAVFATECHRECDVAGSRLGSSASMLSSLSRSGVRTPLYNPGLAATGSIPETSRPGWLPPSAKAAASHGNINVFLGERLDGVELALHS